MDFVHGKKEFVGTVLRQMEFVIDGPAIFNDTDTMKAVIRVTTSRHMKDLIEF